MAMMLMRKLDIFMPPLTWVMRHSERVGERESLMQLQVNPNSEQLQRFILINFLYRAGATKSSRLSLSRLCLYEVWPLRRISQLSSKSKALVTVFILLFFSTSGSATTKVYRFVDQSGKVHFTDRPQHDGFVRLVETWKGWVEVKTNPNYTLNKRKFLPLIQSISEQHELPAHLISAVIHAESHYNPNSVSAKGAVGLMQLMPATAKQYGVYDRHNPTQNILGGVKYLRKLMTLFNEDLDLALAAYNAGENAVKRHGNQIPPYRETQRYIEKVRLLYAQYQQNLL
jgi:hypothetical protein